MAHPMPKRERIRRQNQRLLNRVERMIKNRTPEEARQLITQLITIIKRQSVASPPAALPSEKRDTVSELKRQRKRAALKRIYEGLDTQLSTEGEWLTGIKNRIARQLTAFRARNPNASNQQQFCYLRGLLIRLADDYNYDVKWYAGRVVWYNRSNGQRSYVFSLTPSYQYWAIKSLWSQKGTWRVAIIYNETALRPYARFVTDVKRKRLPLTVLHVTDPTLWAARVTEFKQKNPLPKAA